jgi:hypothetical protein
MCEPFAPYRKGTDLFPKCKPRFPNGGKVFSPTANPTALKLEKPLGRLGLSIEGHILRKDRKKKKKTVSAVSGKGGKVPLSKRVPLPRPFGPYFPLEAKNIDKVVAFDNVLTPAECDYLRTMVEKFMKSSTEAFGLTYIQKESNPWTIHLEKRLAALLQTHPGKLETIQLHRYKRGHEVSPSLDTLSEDDKGSAGQRTSTFIVFLNDLPELEEGGRIVFPSLKAGIRPKQGTAIGRNNVHPKTKRVDETMVHGEETLYLKRSTKYLLVVRSRERAYEPDE